jgi:hypothetical protein
LPRSQSTQSLRRHVADHRIRVLDECESFLPPAVPRLMRRRARYITMIRAVVDAFARGDFRQAVTDLVRALRAYPVGPIDPKVVQQVAHRIRRRSQDRDFWRAGLVE